MYQDPEKNEGSSHKSYNPVDHLLIFTHFFGYDRPDSTLVQLPGWLIYPNWATPQIGVSFPFFSEICPLPPSSIVECVVQCSVQCMSPLVTVQEYQYRLPPIIFLPRTPGFLSLCQLLLNMTKHRQKLSSNRARNKPLRIFHNHKAPMCTSLA